MTETIETLELKLEAMTLQNLEMSRANRSLKHENERLLNENIALRAGKLADEDIQRIAENIGYQLSRFHGLSTTRGHQDVIAGCIKIELGQ